MPKTLAEHLQILRPEQHMRVVGDASRLITAPFVETDYDVQVGGVFVARVGRSRDGHSMIAGALARGAAAVVGEKPIHLLSQVPLSVPYVHLANAQEATGWLAASYYDFPSHHLTTIGITGTDGKTTTTHLLHSVLQAAFAQKVGFISTIAADFGTKTADTGLHVTTPGAPQVQQFLAQMVDANLHYAILEMTSHGLAQGRLNGVELDVAILTNLTHEHLDYHGSFEAYRAAKALMFKMLDTSARKAGVPKISILNRDDPSYDFFAAIPADRVCGYGLSESADFRAEQIEFRPDATVFTVQDHPITLKLFGRFNVYNALAAIAAARCLGADWSAVQQGLAAVEGVSGRMERIYAGQAFTALVDFAHTPNALKNALETGRAMLPDGGRLIAVFGSAGLRDVEKRRLMAEAAVQVADFMILTAEDPRTESLDGILQTMAQGCIAQGGVEGETFLRIRDRGQAIYEACQRAQAGDIVMICGKGHEQSMAFGMIEYPWDDREALRAALQGAPLATLPTAHEGSG